MNQSLKMREKFAYGPGDVGWGLEPGNYDGAFAQQLPETVRTIVPTGYGVPVTCMIQVFISLSFCNIDRIYPQMEKNLAERGGLAG